MSQNIISLTLSDEQVASAEAALTQLEIALAGLLSLEPDERRSLMRMGPKSEVFCRQTVRVLRQSPQIVPPSLDLAGAVDDLVALDRLRPLVERLQRISSRGQDTEIALGSDVMDVALDGYAQLKLSGAAHGLEDLRKELSSRFAKARRARVPSET